MLFDVNRSFFIIVRNRDFFDNVAAGDIFFFEMRKRFEGKNGIGGTEHGFIVRSAVRKTQLDRPSPVVPGAGVEASSETQACFFARRFSSIEVMTDAPGRADCIHQDLKNASR